MAKHSVNDSGDLRKYFSAIPNIVLQLGLSPYELALYVHLKQVAGDDGGVCWKSRATLAKESGMSSGMVTKARQGLEQVRKELGGQPLIRVCEEASKSGGLPTCRITITDIWAVNMTRFTTSPHDVAAGATSPHDQPTSYSDQPTSPQRLKEKPFKKNPEEYKRDFLADLRNDPIYSHVDFDRQIELMRRWLARPENSGRRMTERFVINWLNKIDRPVDVPITGNGKTDRAAWEAEQRRKHGWPSFDERTT